MSIAEILNIVSSFATTVGVTVAAWQLWLSRQQNITAFEDSLAREYRELTAKLPTKALLEEKEGEQLSEEEYRNHFDEFYRYFDLSNEQAFLHKQKRVRCSTWKFWHDGIASNLKRPAFKRAWSEVCARCGSDFSELRTLFPPAVIREITNDDSPNVQRRAL